MNNSVTLQMTVIDIPSRLELSILKEIKNNMPKGIHVRALEKSLKMSPPTLVKYLRVLEDERRLIFHEKIKNKDVYRILSRYDQTFEESQQTYSKSLYEFISTIHTALDHSSNWELSERLQVYQHVVNVLALLRYVHQLRIDIERYDKNSIPKDIANYMKDLELYSTIINRGIDSNLGQFYFMQLSKTIDESMNFLKNIAKRKRGIPSKYIKKILEDMKTHPEIYSKFKKIDDNSKRLMNLIKKTLSTNIPDLAILVEKHEKGEITRKEFEEKRMILLKRTLLNLNYQDYLKHQKRIKKKLPKTTKTGVKIA